MVIEVDDDVLVAAARAGDTAAFEELVRRYEAPVYRVAVRMLGADADAQDATQETFVRAWRGLARFRADSAVGTWLYRIATNRCLTVLASRRPTVVLDDELPGRSEDPARVAERHAQMDAISAAVAALPGDQRAALVLRDYEGLSYDEVADVLQIGVGAVKSRIHRARATVLKRTVGWR